MKIKNAAAAGILTLVSASFASCLKDDGGISYDELIPNAVVTVKPEGESFFLQLDDSTVIYPDNVKTSPFGDREVRAFINYKVISEEAGKQTGHVYWFKELLTKQTAESDGTDNDSKYGNDPVDILNAFPTVCEDGHLTLGFRTYWGRYGSVKHEVNLLTGVDADDPYAVEFRHNANGDVQEVVSDGYVAFRLDRLPDTGGKTVKLTLKYLSPDGEKTVRFDYRTRPGDGK